MVVFSLVLFISQLLRRSFIYSTSFPFLLLSAQLDLPLSLSACLSLSLYSCSFIPLLFLFPFLFPNSYANLLASIFVRPCVAPRQQLCAGQPNETSDTGEELFASPRRQFFFRRNILFLSTFSAKHKSLKSSDVIFTNNF